MLAVGVADRIVVSITPRILGSGTDAIGDMRNERITDALRLNGHSVHLVGNVILIAANLGPPATFAFNGESRTVAGHA